MKKHFLKMLYFIKSPELFTEYFETKVWERQSEI